MPGLSEAQAAEARAWAERTAAAQGLPLRVSDPAVLRQVAALVRPGLGAPDRGQAGGVEPIQAAFAGGDGDVVDDRGDDRGLAA